MLVLLLGLVRCLCTDAARPGVDFEARATGTESRGAVQKHKLGGQVVAPASLLEVASILQEQQPEEQAEEQWSEEEAPINQPISDSRIELHDSVQDEVDDSAEDAQMVEEDQQALLSAGANDQQAANEANPSVDDAAWSAPAEFFADLEGNVKNARDVVEDVEGTARKHQKVAEETSTQLKASNMALQTAMSDYHRLQENGKSWRTSVIKGFREAEIDRMHPFENTPDLHHKQEASTQTLNSEGYREAGHSQD